MSSSSGIVLTEAERLELLAALRAAGLDTSADTTWDSLDVACVLAVLEHSLGIVLDPAAAHPRMLRSAPALERSIGEQGIRRQPAARMRLDLTDLGPAPTGRERRRAEYRLALARPGVRAAVTRRGPLILWAAADTAADLPIGTDALAALGFGDPVETDLDRSGLEALVEDVERSAAAGHVIERIEADVRSFVTDHTGQLWAPANSVITISELRRLGYYDAHPEQVAHLGTDLALLPAACLGAFRSLAARPMLATFSATVFRREPYYELATGRLPSYACRELLWHTSPDQEPAMAEAAEHLLASLADELNLRWRWCEANDPFFLAPGEGGRKRELRTESPAGEIAVASVNAHGRHFTERGYGCRGWHTGCAGLGLERWALAAGVSR